MTHSKLDAHAETIRAELAKGTSQRELARRYGVARSTIQHFLDKVEPDAPRVEDTELLNAQIKDLTKRLNKERAADVIYEQLRRDVQDAITAAPVKYQPPEIAAGDPDAHVQVLLLSDTHVGEIVTPEAVGGMNEFNWEVLCQRMAKIQRSLLSFQANRPYPISELKIWVLGDMCGGAHHEELAITNEFPEAEQAYRWGMLFGQWVEELIEHFDHIDITAVGGNHARIPKKPANKQIFNSYDWLAGKISETYLQNYIDLACVSTNISRNGFEVVDVVGLNHLLFHGDGIRSSMPGVPWGGVMRRTNELRKQYAAYGTKLDGFCLGHFHQANVVAGGIYMNGSVKGPDEYTLKQFGSSDPPEQLLLTFNPKKSRLTDVSFINP